MSAPTRIEIMHKRHGQLPATCATCARCHLTPIGGPQSHVRKCAAYPGTDTVAAVYWDTRWPACGEHESHDH